MNDQQKLKLKVLNGFQKNLSIETNKSINIGSAISCGLRILSPEVASLHASLNLSVDGRWRLRHLAGAKAETLLNGVEIGEAPVSEGDLIQFGKVQVQLVSNNSSESFELSSKNAKWNESLLQLPSISKAQHPVLLLGPSGSGKDFLANKIHELSDRNKKNKVTVNCAALNENLIESELFGHKKGSFTGAVSDRAGAFETAQGGTLFLDEIGDLPLSSQAKLLRALENKEVKALGSDKVINVDVRIIAATHKNLFELVSKGLFRQDLLYRLNVIQIQVPSLLERKEDIIDILNRFAKEAKVQLSDSANMILIKHQWPGNIREIKNFFARAQSIYPGLLITEDRIPSLLDSSSLSSGNANQNDNLSGIPFLKQLEKDMIIERLKYNGWNQRRTALELGIPKSTLNDRIRKYGILKDRDKTNDL